MSPIRPLSHLSRRRQFVITAASCPLAPSHAPTGPGTFEFVPSNAPTAAEVVGPVLRTFLPEDLPLYLEFWDGSSLGDPDCKARVVFKSPDAFSCCIAWAPESWAWHACSFPVTSH